MRFSLKFLNNLFLFFDWYLYRSREFRKAFFKALLLAGPTLLFSIIQNWPIPVKIYDPTLIYIYGFCNMFSFILLIVLLIKFLPEELYLEIKNRDHDT
jgi:hypothetical protein